MILALIRRDLTLALGRPGLLLLPTLFFVMVAVLMPFALGPDIGLLARLAPGILWIAALLASLLPIADLYAQDAADGTLDQLASRGIANESLAFARMLALWLAFTLPLLLALPVAATLLGLPAAQWPSLALALALGGLGLAALANLAAALTLGARGSIAALLVLPLAIPMLVFGSTPDAPSAGRLLAAAALLLAAVCPFGTALALGAART
ncbi:heme exporter protein CcmB [Sandaracinobacteroides saxicola]|uniref:Heme exporter protein B n=1 Tax=Sandaracinobacteroides saxicola TaxID=2759707 RepID=A0A7G5IL99_9SPHN|nr:heme exporter protein CcmB [Sandaracinobacteroides saxicola]QMW24141.1 heme exporter protein CcmB [Sandaracinobacteroides saxicola]